MTLLEKDSIITEETFHVSDSSDVTSIQTIGTNIRTTVRSIIRDKVSNSFVKTINDIWLDDTTNIILSFLPIQDCILFIGTCQFFYQRRYIYFPTLKQQFLKEQKQEREKLHRDSEGSYINLAFCVYFYEDKDKQQSVLSNTKTKNQKVISDMNFVFSVIKGKVIIEHPWTDPIDYNNGSKVFYTWYHWLFETPLYCIFTPREVIEWNDITSYIFLPNIIMMANHFVTYMDNLLIEDNSLQLE